MSVDLATDRRDPWLGIELRHLAALLAISTEGTFSDAALSLGYVQSAVSGQVATLERLTGTLLVERSRGPGSQRLTPAGEMLLLHAREILAELDAARTGLLAATVETPLAGIRVRVCDELTDRIVGRILHTTVASSYDLRISAVETGCRDSALAALLEQRADVILTGLPLDHPDVGTAEILRHRPVVLTRADSLLAETTPRLTLADVSHLPLVVWREGEQPSRVERELAEHGLEPNIVARAESTDTLVELVTMGVGAAIVPSGAVPPDPALTTVPLDEELPVRTTGVAWLRSRSGEQRIRRFVRVACRLRDDL